jgi:hypothetical protein
MFVFLDEKLVIDLGGVHTQLSGSVSLDDLPWLVKGQNYAYVLLPPLLMLILSRHPSLTNCDSFYMFYCERHTTSSQIEITTSIQLSCPTVLDRFGPFYLFLNFFKFFISIFCVFAGVVFVEVMVNLAAQPRI